MNYITKYEIDNKELVSKFSIDENNNLAFRGIANFKDTFEVGDIVCLKEDNEKIGVVFLTEEDEISIYWNDNSESVKFPVNLINIPPTIGIQLLDNEDLLKSWEELSNGKNESFDLKCLYINDKMINEVPFIRAYKNTDAIIDKRFRRKFSLYRKFGNTQIYRTNIYTMCDGNIGLNDSRFAYYLLQDSVVYYLGLDLCKEDLLDYLFKK